MALSGNGQAHEHEWQLHREDEGRSYEQPDEGWSGDVCDLPYREVTVRLYYCVICRTVTVDRDYGELIVPLSRPPRPTRRPWWFRLPVTWRPW
jgi:hypothetical protein